MNHRRGRRFDHPLQKDRTTLLRTSEETGGECTMIEVEVAPGGGTALHRHLSYAERRYCRSRASVEGAQRPGIPDSGG